MTISGTQSRIFLFEAGGRIFSLKLHGLTTGTLAKRAFRVFSISKTVAGQVAGSLF